MEEQCQLRNPALFLTKISDKQTLTANAYYNSVAQIFALSQLLAEFGDCPPASKLQSQFVQSTKVSVRTVEKSFKELLPCQVVHKVYQSYSQTIFIK